MAFRLDDTDRKILAELQADSGRSLDEIAHAVGSSKTPVWNRIRKMREAGSSAEHRPPRRGSLGLRGPPSSS
jgi:DNA-binding Lrp family transcriptional regulator